MRAVIILVLVTILSGLSAQAQSITRIEIPPGRDTVTLKGTVGESNKDYVLHVTEGQRLHVNLTSPNPYGRFNVYRTNYDEPLGSAGEIVADAKDATGWGGILKAAGDYHIYVFNPRGGHTAFTLEITLLPAGPRADDFEGAFEIPGKNPRGFTNFEYFALITMQLKPSGSMPIKPNGYVRAGGRKYTMTHIEILGTSLSFETVDLAGTAYQFKGNLLPRKPDGPTFSGWLSKIVNGKKAAEAQVEFDLIEGVD